MELLELFKRQLASTTGTSSKNTIKNYVSDVRHFISWFEAVTGSMFEASSITPDVIFLYQNSMGGLLLDGQLQSNSQLSASSMKRHLSSIRKFFTVLEGENIVRENPFKKIVTEESVEPTDYWHLKSFRDYLMMGNASKITVKNYLSDISGFARWYEEAVLPTVENPLSSNQGFYLITQAIVEDYRKRLVEIQNAAPRTINRKLSALRRYLEFATRKGFITNQEISINSVEAEIAEEVEDLPKVPLSEITTQFTPQKRTYSRIPPVRLVQKLFINPYLLLEEGAANAITAFLIGKKVTGIANLPQKLSAQIVAKNALRAQNQGLSTLLGVRNIEKEFYAPEKVSLSGLPIHQKMFHHVRFTRPNWYKKYHNYAFVHYIHFALLVIFASGVGVALYQNLVVQKQTPTFAAATAPPRILSFQGRLTDALDNPITSPQPVRFMIYNSLAATGAAELWEETRTISPDQDGIFSVLLGSDSTGANASSCGSFPPGSPYNTSCLIPSTVFSDNSQIWLGVTIANSTELAPRQKIATVGYATNSEFLQGLPPTSAVSSFVNAVLALDSTGSFNLNDGIEHTFQVSNGTLTLKAQTLNLTTSLGTNGNIILNPEGSGKVDIQKPIINNSNTGNLVPGGVEINDKFGVLATESAVAAFIVNNNTTGGDIFAASSSGTTRFIIGNDGSITSGFYTGQNAVLYGTQTTGVIGQVTTASTGLCLQSGISIPTWGTCGTSYWNLTNDNGALTPFSSTLDLLIGGQSTSSAKFAFINNASGAPTASISGNLSISVPTGATGANLFNIFNGGSLNFQTSGGGNTGLTSRLFIANDGRIGIGTTSPFSRNALDIRGLSGTSSTASISATSSYATLVVDNAGRGDLIAASASGVPNFVVKNNGDIIVGPGGGGKITAAIIDPYLVQNQKTTGIQSLTFQTLGASNADFIFQNTSTTLSTLTMAGQFQLPITGSTGGIVLGGDTQLFRGAADRIDIAANDSLNFLSGSGGLLTNGTTRIDASGNGTFANINITGTCTGCVNTGNSPFYVSQGAIVPGNSTLDFLLGGIATTSAKFAVLNVAGGTPTASVSAQNADGQALVLGSDGTIQTTRNNTLTIGGTSTGNINLKPLNGAGVVNLQSDLTLGSRLGPIFSISQADSANSFGGSGLLSITNSDTDSSGSLIYLDQDYGSGNAPAIQIADITNNMGVALELITTGIGLQSTHTGGITSGRAIDLSGGAAGISNFTGRYISVDPARIHTAASTITDTGNFLYFDRNNVVLNASGVFNVTGDLVSIQSNCTETSGTCNDSGKIVQLTQNFAKSTGTIFNITNLGLGSAIDITSNSGGKAALIINKTGANDILAASVSGVTKFAIKNDGTASSSAGFTVDGIGNIQSTNNQTLTIGGGSTGNLILGKAAQTLTLPGFTTNGGLFYTNTSGVLAQTGTGGATQCLLGGAGTPTFGSCSGGTNTSPFYEIASQGIIVQGNTTEDFLLGGTASSSARFIVNGLATGISPTASISATNGNGIYLSAQSGTIQSLRNNILSIGGNTTGTVSINPLASNFTGIGTSNPRASLDVRGSLGITGGGTLAVASISGRTSYAALQIDNSLGDLFTASSSGLSRFVISQNGNVGIGTTSPLYAFDVNKKTAAFNSGQDGSIASWTNTTDTGAGGQLEQFGLVFLNGYVYQVGGHTGSGDLDTVQYARVKNDGSLDTWVTSPNRLPEARLWHGTVTANGYIYAVGGHSSVAVPTNPAVYYAKVNADGTVGTWTTTTPIPSPRVRITHSVVVANGYMYVVGGDNGGNQSTVWYSKINPDGTLGSWVTGSALPIATSDSSVIVDNGFIYSMGGNTGSTNAIYLAKINYDGSIGPWIGNPNNLPNNEYMHSAIAVNGFVYVLGGANNPTSVYYAKFNSNGTIPAFSTNPASLPNSHQGSGITYGNGYIYISGGFTTDNVAYGSIARVSLAANLDLLGLTSTSIASSSGLAGGGSIFAGNIFAKNLEVGGSGTVWGNLAVSDTLSAKSLSISGRISGKALSIINETGNQAIFTASASGVTKFTIGNDGQVMIGNINADPSTALGAGTLYYNTVSQAFKFYNGSTWATIGSGSSSGPFGVLQGAIVPTNTTYDFLLGGTATTSAKFSVLNLSGVATTIASVSGNLIVMPDNGTGGRVGIGTINPTNSLTIVGAPNITPVSISANRNTGNPDMAYFTNSASGGDSFVIGVGATGTNIPANTVGFGLATVGYRAFLTNSGLFGIGTSSPISALHITRPINYGATGKALAVFDQIENQDIFTASAAGITRFVIKNDGRLGINTFQSPTGVNPTSVLQVYGLSTQPIASISGKTSGPTLLLTNDGTGDILAASVSGVQKFRINAAGDLIVGDGSGKIYGGGFDPLFTIDGKKFSTYASGINGMKEEYIGSANLAYDAAAGGYAYTLDFNNFEYGSELWTFSRVIDPDLTKVNVLLTPTSQARTWFRRDPVNRKLILYSDRPTSVTFRFTAPRFDYALYPSSNHSHDIAGLQAPAAPGTTGTGEADPMDSFFASLSIQFNNGLFVVLDGFGNIVHRVDGFSNLIAANLEAGFIHARSITADTLSAGSASLGNATANTFAVAANTITIGGQDIRQFIIDTVTAAGFGQNTIISPLAEVETIKTNTIRPLADGGDITVKGKLIAESDKSATDSSVVALDVRGSATISGSLATNSILTNEATIAGTLRAGNIIAGNIQGLEDKISSVASQFVNNHAATLAVGTVRADFGIFEQGITSMGPITSNILTATDQLAVGSNFTITNNAINTVGSDLAIQSLRQGNIAFQGGLIRMDTDGNMSVNGNFNLLGKIDAVHGVFSGTLTTPALATDLISPVADSDISLSFKDSKFNIQNSKTATGSAVLSIDNKGNIQSSGSATFAKLNFNLVGKAEATSLTEAIATGSAGFATLRTGQPELTIKNNIITSESLIYITPFGNTNNKVLYLLRQIPEIDQNGLASPTGGSFTIGISGQLPTHDIQFNWLIVN